MCFKLDNVFRTRELAREFSRNPKIAHRNIRVFKALDSLDDDDTLHSPYWSQQYKPGKTYETKMSFSYFHCHTWNLSVERGLHSFVSRKAFDESYVKFAMGVKLYEMYIPKGAKYFINKKGEIVSSALVFKALRKK